MSRKPLTFSRDDLEKKIVRTNSAKLLRPTKSNILKKTKSDSNIKYKQTKETAKTVKPTKLVKSTRTVKPTKNVKGNIASYDEFIRETTQDYEKIYEKKRLSIKEYEYIKYLNKDNKLISGYINKIYYNTKHNEVGWIMSSYLGESVKTWCIFPLKISDIYVKKDTNIKQNEDILKELEQHKQIISSINKYLMSQCGDNYTKYMNKNIQLQ